MSSTTRKDEVMNGLLAGISQLTSSEKWQEWLAVQSRFHRYSFNNTMLIELQCPQATRVAGFNAWRRLGRNVRKGEKAIWILAPVTRKASDDTEDMAADNHGRVLVAFKPAAVFDLAQTDGEPLPETPVQRLQGEDPSGSYDRLREVARDLGYTVEEDYLPGEVNGDCAFDHRRIRVEMRNDEIQQVKTLCHELAHAILHEGHHDRPLAELEAESVAYIVCANLGINSANYSFSYVSVWAGGGDEAVSRIKAAGSRIQRTADQILSSVLAESAADTAAA